MPAFAAPGNPAKHVISSPPMIEVIQGPACWESMLILKPEATRATADFKHTASRWEAEVLKDPGVEALLIGAVLGMQVNPRVKPRRILVVML
jgi:hypothetical protein